MAKILVQGEWATAEIIDISDEVPWYVFRCQHGHEDTDRGHFEDTVVFAERHVDDLCTGPISRKAEKE